MSNSDYDSLYDKLFDKDGTDILKAYNETIISKRQNLKPIDIDSVIDKRCFVVGIRDKFNSMSYNSSYEFGIHIAFFPNIFIRCKSLLQLSLKKTSCFVPETNGGPYPPSSGDVFYNYINHNLTLECLYSIKHFQAHNGGLYMGSSSNLGVNGSTDVSDILEIINKINKEKEQSYKDLETEKAQLKQSYKDLEAEKTKLKQSYEDLEAEKAHLKQSYEDLETEKAKLEALKTELDTERANIFKNRQKK